MLGPIGGGIVAGVLHTVLGPDHLCTIITLSACQGAKAFWFGVRWAAGHLVGMCLIGCTFAIINHTTGGAAWEVYEHYVDYLIGAMLVTVGAYFALNADRFFDQEWNPKQASCACHADLASSEGDNECGYGSDKLASGCPPSHEHGEHGHSHGSHGHGSCAHEDDVKKQLIEPSKKAQGGDDEVGPLGLGGFRGIGSVAVGFVQGVACPAGIVGMSFLKHYSVPEMLLFVAIFFIVTTLSMGALAAAYGIATKHFINSASLARGIYYTSCSLSILLGCAWLYLNHAGVLDEYLGHDHDHDHGHGAHAGHDHGHEGHHHHHDHDGVDINSLLLFAAVPR